MVKQANKLTQQDFPICIGPETQAHYQEVITNSKTCLYNGLMGTIGNRETLQGVAALFKAMCTIPFGMVAGGDSTAAAHILGFSNKLHLSTGGGALVAYLSGQKLPALEILK